MKIKTNTLKQALDNLRPIIGRKMTLPILSCVKIYSHMGKLIIEASNLDEFMSETLDCADDIKPFCVNYKQLCDSIGGEETGLSFRPEYVDVSIGIGMASIQTLDVEEFPQLPKQKFTAHSVNCEELAKSITSVSWAACVEPSRPVLNSVHMISAAKVLRVESSNGRELAYVETPIIGSVFDISIPVSFSGNLASTIMRAGGILSSSDSWVKCSHNSGEYYCKILEQKFPDVSPIIRAEKKLLGDAKTSELQQIFNRCDLFSDPSRPSTARVIFSSEGASVAFSGKNSKLQYCAYGNFNPHESNLNANSLKNCLRAVNSEIVKIHAASAGALMIIIESGNLFIHTTEMRTQ